MSTSNPKASLFSGAHGRTSTPVKIRGFLGLPGEIRNRIYHYYFQEDFRCEIAARGVNFDHRTAKVIKLCLGIVNKDGPIVKYQEESTPTTVRVSRRLGHYTRVHGIQTSWLNSLCGLILVCKQIHCEALVFLYCKTTFVFAAPRRISNFIQVLPKKNLSYITKLHLHYASYGCPRRTKDCGWQEKHLASWTRACKAASKNFVNLQELEVWLQVNASPLRFNLRQSWLEPLLQFRRLTCARKFKDGTEPIGATSHETTESSTPLQVVKVHFKTYWSSQYALARNAVPELADANTNLHHIFAQAITRAIFGASEEEAMVDFNRAWEGKYQRWQHHLNFSCTGW